MSFEVGDYVVAPGCGVGVVESIEAIELGDTPTKMYKIHLESNDTTMWVPTWRVGVDGIRSPMTPEIVAKAMETMAETEAPKKRANWNRRQRRYNDLLMSNDPLQMAALLGELASVRREKKLSFGERRLYDRVRDMMEAELTAALDDDRESIVGKLDDVLQVEEAVAA